MMTAQEAIAALNAADDQDYEAAHVEADKVLCELLKSLGYQDVVERFEAIGRGYA